jgi:hypothetical protein
MSAAAAAGGARKRLPPLRLSSVFGQMMTDCPAQVAAYGQCLSANLDNLRKDACAAEFAAMRQCATTALGKVRAGRR